MGEKLLDDLRDQIDKDVYKNEYYPNKQYYEESIYQEEDDDYSSFPTGEFMDAWELDTYKNATFLKVKGSVISISYDPSNMSADPHRSIVHKKRRKGKDMRLLLGRILNVNGYTSSLMVGKGGSRRHVSKLRKPYWDNFIKKIKSKSLISKYMKQESKKLGITLK